MKIYYGTRVLNTIEEASCVCGYHWEMAISEVFAYEGRVRCGGKAVP